MLGKQLARLETEIADSEARMRMDEARLRNSFASLRTGTRSALGSKAVMIGGAAVGAIGTLFWSRHRHHERTMERIRAELAAEYAAERPRVHTRRRRRASFATLAQRWSPVIMPMVSPLLDRKVAMLLATVGVPVVVKPLAPLPTMAQVDLRRYAGLWYEIARLPTRRESPCASDVTSRYEPDDKGGLVVVNRCVRADGGVDQAEGRARVPDPSAPGQMEVTFAPSALRLWPGVWGDYWLMFVDDGYSVALVGDPERNRLWILARASRLDEGDLEALKSLAARHGFDTTRLVMTPHTEAHTV